jgi:hypothetical protein
MKINKAMQEDTFFIIFSEFFSCSFEGFVFGGELTAVTQYHCCTVVPRFVEDCFICFQTIRTLVPKQSKTEYEIYEIVLASISRCCDYSIYSGILEPDVQFEL